MKPKSFDLFLLMLNLSQLSNLDIVKKVYCESLNSSFEGISTHILQIPDETADINLQLWCKEKLYGFVTIFTQSTSITQEEESLIRNSASLLGIIITNLIYSKELKEKERKLSEVLASKVKLLDNIAQMVPEIIYIYNLDTAQNVYINTAFEKFFGISKTQLKNMGQGFLLELIHPDDIMIIVNHHNSLKSVNEGESRECEYRLKDHSGKWHWLLSRDIVYQKDENNVTTEILGCATDITSIKNIEAQLRSSIEDKKLLLREIHHRVKNNLAIVNSFLSLQIMNINDKLIQSYFESTQNRIMAMASVHEELYKSKELSSINIDHYIKQLISKLSFIAENRNESIEIKYDIRVESLSMNTLIPLALIVNELTTNSLKHAETENGTLLLTISLQKLLGAEHKYRLTITDNGAIKQKEMPEPSENSIGLQIVEALVTQLHGTIFTEQNENYTTVVEFNEIK